MIRLPVAITVHTFLSLPYGSKSMMSLQVLYSIILVQISTVVAHIAKAYTCVCD